MTTIESKKVVIARPATEVYDYVSDLNNFKALLPKTTKRAVKPIKLPSSI